MPVLLFTADEVARSLILRMRRMSREIADLADLGKRPLNPGESVQARHHELAKLGKQLADAFVDFDVIASAEADAGAGLAPAAPPTPDQSRSN